jgi:sodium transport system permease protein
MSEPQDSNEQSGMIEQSGPPPVFKPRVGRIVRKELREILRDRRTILTMVVMPLLLYPMLTVACRQLFFVGAMQSTSPVIRVGFNTPREARLMEEWRFIGESVLQQEAQQQRRELGEAESTDTTPALPLSFGLEAMTTPRVEVFILENLDQAVRDYGIDLGIQISEDNGGWPVPGEDWAATSDLIFVPGSSAAEQALEFYETRLEAANRGFMALRLRSLGVSQRPVPWLAQRVPAQVEVRPQTAALPTLLPLVLILMTMAGASYPAIDLTAGERERGTLEVLVASPVPRIVLLWAKYLAVLVVAVLTAGVNLIVMRISVSISGLSPLLLGDEGMPAIVMIQVVALLLLFAAFFSAVLLAVSSFARSFREAQALLIPLMVVSIAPGIVSIFPHVELTSGLSVVPLLNVVLLARDLFQLQSDPVLTLAVLLSTGLYAVAALAIAAQAFGSEGVLYQSETGWMTWWSRREQRPAATIGQTALTLALAFPANILVQNTLGQITGLELSMSQQLMLTTLGTVLVFAAIPLVALRLGSVNIARGFNVGRGHLLAYLAAVILGLSLWPFAHELFLALHGADGFAVLYEQQLQDYLDRLRLVPLPLVLLAVAIAPAVCEELFFRGYLLSAIAARFSSRRAIVASAVIFGLFHLLMHGVVAPERFVSSTLLGLVLGWLCVRSRSIWPGMLLHASHNGLLVLVMYCQPLLESWGWGLEGETHLPTLWLVVAAVVATLGAALVFFSCPKNTNSELESTNTVAEA